MATAPVQPDPKPAKDMPWGTILWFTVLIAICYAPVIRKLASDWMVDEDMGHGFFVPAVALYIFWQRKDEVLGRSYRPSPLGLILVVLGALMLIAGTMGVEYFITRVALVMCIWGVVLTLGGKELLKELLFPLSLLFFMIPLPAVIYVQITFPLQLLASSVAETVLNAVGIPVFRDGNVLDLPSQKLSVVEACSGIRSLLSLSFLSLVYGYFFDTKSWMRWVLLAATIPIAITANAFRVTLTGIFSEQNPELAKGIFHSLEGWVIFMIALVLLVMTHQIINRVYGAFHAKS
jgi:exosortase